MRRRFLTALVALVALVAATSSASASSTSGRQVRIWTIHYRAHNGAARRAYVLLPAWYGPKNHPAIPLVISHTVAAYRRERTSSCGVRCLPGADLP